MLFRVPGHADAEVGRHGVLQVGIEVDAFVQVYDLVDQVDGVGMAVCLGLESALAADGITPEGQYIAYSDEVQVDEGIFRLLDGESSADDVRHGFHLVAVHERCADADGTRALADGALLQQAWTDLAVDVFLPVVGDVYECRCEGHQGVHRAVDRVNVLALQWWQQFDAEPAVVRLVEDVRERHLAMDSGRSRRTGDSQRAASSTGCPRRAA